MTTAHPLFSGAIIEGVALEPLDPFRDHRGYTAPVLVSEELPWEPKQVLMSYSAAGVLRGLHFHARQWDLWHLVRGRIQVALVDLRSEKAAPPTMLFTWDGDQAASVRIPPGVAHGYLALTDMHMLYVLSETHTPTDEYSIAWNERTFDIGWANEEPILSDRDASAPPLSWAAMPSFDLSSSP